MPGGRAFWKASHQLNSPRNTWTCPACGHVSCSSAAPSVCPECDKREWRTLLAECIATTAWERDFLYTCKARVAQGYRLTPKQQSTARNIWTRSQPRRG